MTARELLQFVLFRLSRFRQWNFAFAIICPFLTAILVLNLLSHEMIPRPFVLPAIAAAVLIGIVFLEESMHLLKRVTPAEAATVIDRACDGKDRFLTLATVQVPNGPDDSLIAASRRFIEAQSQIVGNEFSSQKHLRFSLEPVSRISLIVSPAIAVAIVLLMLISPEQSSAYREYVPSQRVAARADALRDLAEQEPALPAEVKRSLEMVADSIEEKGLLDPETTQLVDDSLETVEKFERSEIDLSEVDQSEIDKIRKQELDQEGDTPKESSSNESRTEQDSKGKSEEQEEQKAEGQKEPRDAQQSSKSEQENEESSKNEQGSTEEQTAKAEQGSKGEQGKEESEQGTEDGKQSGEKGSKSGDEAKEDPNGEQGKSDEKGKGTAGVGEGKGKGKSGEQKEQHGETQSGHDDSGAKTGDAENSAGDQGSGKSKGEKGEGKSGGGQKGAGKEKGSEGDEKSQSEGKTGALKEAKGELNKLKEEIEKKGEGESSQNSQQEIQQREGKNEGASEKEGSAKKQGNSSEQKSGQQSGSKGEKSGEKNGESKNEQQANGSQQPGMGEGEQQPGEKKGEKPTKGNQGKNRGQAEQGDSAEGDRDATQDTSRRAEKRPDPTDSAPRFGPFEGGNDGNIAGKQQAGVRVEVPEEEKITVRHLGSEDKQLYRNNPGAQSRTALGSAEFEKPKADVGKVKQPIPVEYRDLFR